MNAVPSFDLIKDLKVGSNSFIRQFYASKGWFVKKLGSFASSTVLNIAQEFNAEN
jgi:hypothetical protein